MPEYVETVLLARHAGVSPMELLEWPAFWVDALRNVVSAEHQVERERNKGSGTP